MPSRIEDLERRVRQDPSSIAFGALAEEYRRAGRLEEAVAACRSGLERHPSYLSARVTLGRALQEMGETGDARAEFTYVLSLAPDNLAAIRGLAELHGDGGEAVPAFAAPAAAPELEAGHEQEAEPEPRRVPDADLDLRAEPEPDRVERTSAPIAHKEPDFAALDASIDRADAASAAGAEREAQIERLEIWLTRIEQAREA